MIQDRWKSRRATMGGFNLAEVLVAVALLAVIVLAVFGLVTAGVKQAFGGKKMTVATTVAQSALERANIQKPQDLMGAVDTDTTKTKTWSKTKPLTGTAAESVTTPAALGGSSVANVAQDAWRLLLRDADLPASVSNPAKLTVTMTAKGGTNFGDCTMVQILVDVEWTEYGARKRQVRLQSLNLRVVPS